MRMTGDRLVLISFVSFFNGLCKNVQEKKTNLGMQWFSELLDGTFVCGIWNLYFEDG